MSHWYLVSSLPTLRFGEKPPMDAKAFRAACIGWLAADELSVIDAVLSNEPPPVSDVAQAWWDGEVQLRNAVVRVRAKKHGTDAASFLKTHSGFSVTVEERVADAFTCPDPLEQEAELDRVRWTLAEALCMEEPFGVAAVLAFAVKIIIAERWAALDETVGKASVEELVSSTIVHT